jgi:excisionase family DNA binding protein
MICKTPTLLLSARDAAKLLAISERTLSSITAPRGPLPAVKVGRRSVRYSLRNVEAWIVSHKEEGASL